MKKLLFILFSSIVFTGCREVYRANFPTPDTGYLVVEGYISSGNTPTTITLSRSLRLSDKLSFKPENKAQVFVESNKNEKFILTATGNGTYTSAPLHLNSSNTYRINITTTDGKNYVSGFAPVKYTPLIDSISWQKEKDGLQLYVHAHNDANDTRFYQWRYNETWEINSMYLSRLKYITRNNKVYVDYLNAEKTYNDTIQRCWQYNQLRNIAIGSTEKLSKDIVYLPIAYIEPASIKLSVLYSIELKQYALSDEAYRFYLQMKKNNEQLGSVFDAQPSEVKGNITCTTHPNDIVVGYVDVTQEQTKRIFISPREVGRWGYRQICESLEIDNNPDSIGKYGSALLPYETAQTSPTEAIITFMAATPTCVDCTILGSNKKPSYWPN